MSYGQSGIEYTESNFAYNQSNATITPNAIAAFAKVDLTYEYVYSNNSVPVTYNEPLFAYQPVDLVGVAISVIATPAAIAASTTLTAGASNASAIPISTISCPVVIIPQVTATTITIPAGIEIPATIPVTIQTVAPTISRIATVATTPQWTLFVTNDVRPDEVAATTTIPTALFVQDAFQNVGTIKCLTTIGVEPVSRLLQMPSEDTVPPVAQINEPTPAAYALMRHYKPRAQGPNIFIVNGNTVQSYLPTDWGTVTRWIYGGHNSPKDLSASEETLLIAAGYKFDVGPEQ